MTLLISCGNDSDNRADNADSVPVVHESPNGPAPDNSDATNPSLKDSVYTDSAPPEFKKCLFIHRGNNRDDFINVL